MESLDAELFVALIAATVGAGASALAYLSAQAQVNALPDAE